MNHEQSKARTSMGSIQPWIDEGDFLLRVRSVLTCLMCRQLFSVLSGTLSDIGKYGWQCCVSTWGERWSPPGCEPWRAKLLPPSADCQGTCLRSRTGTCISIHCEISKLGQRKKSSSLFLTFGGKGRSRVDTSVPGRGLGGWERLQDPLCLGSLGFPQNQSGKWKS